MTHPISENYIPIVRFQELKMKLDIIQEGLTLPFSVPRLHACIFYTRTESDIWRTRYQKVMEQHKTEILRRSRRHSMGSSQLTEGSTDISIPVIGIPCSLLLSQ